MWVYVNVSAYNRGNTKQAEMTYLHRVPPKENAVILDSKGKVFKKKKKIRKKREAIAIVLKQN